MGILARVKEYEQSYDALETSLRDLLVATLSISNLQTREDLLVQYAKLDVARESLYDTKERLIEAIDNCIRL